MSFAVTLQRHGFKSLRRDTVETLQVNVGKVCNQACHHCHVEAGPKRTESMTRETAVRVIQLLENTPQILFTLPRFPNSSTAPAKYHVDSLTDL